MKSVRQSHLDEIHRLMKTDNTSASFEIRQTTDSAIREHRKAIADIDLEEAEQRHAEIRALLASIVELLGVLVSRG